MDAPAELRAALNDLAEEYPHGALAHAAAALSSAYRAADDSTKAIDSDVAAAAYALTRMPATFAALAATLEETRRRLPAWRPTRILDAGAGPGVAIWASHAIWPTLAQATLIERNPHMQALGRRLVAEAPVDCAVAWTQADLAQPPSHLKGEPFDLGVCSYTINEVPHAARQSLVEWLWTQCDGALALVAPGTPAGFAAIREARDWLIGAGANIVAPCPHAEACPMLPGDWCHFSQRLARSRTHRQLKGGDAPYEDEPYSYVVAARMESEPIAARIIRHPIVRSGYITFDVCAPGGLARAEVTRRDSAAWRAARDARWGSSLARLPERMREL